MPIGYGSRIDLPVLSSSQIGKSIEEDMDLSALRWILTGIELITALIPGVGLGVSASIAAGATAANVGIDYAETGSVSIGTVIGGAIGVGIPAASSVRQGFKTASSVRDIIKEFPRALGSDLLESGAKIAKVEANLKAIREEVKAFTAFKDARFISEGVLKRIPSTQIREIMPAVGDVFNRIKNVNRIGKLVSTTSELEEATNAQVRNFGRTIGMTAGWLSRLDKALLLGGSRGIRAAFTVLRQFGSRSGDKALKAAIELLYKSLTNKTVQKNITKSIIDAAKYTIKKAETTLRYIINPNLIAKKIADKLFEGAEHALLNSGKELSKKIAKWVGKGVKTEQEMQKAFVKNGGTAVDSQWILGYKVLLQDPLGATTLVQFKPLPTNNKKPVIARLSLLQLTDFSKAKSKGLWYLDNIARARNGPKAVAVEDLGLGDGLTNYLGFLPLPQIQRVLGMVQFGKRFAGKASGIFGEKWFTSFKSAVISETIGIGVKIGAAPIALGNKQLYTHIEKFISNGIETNDFKAAFNSRIKTAANRQIRRNNRTKKNISKATRLAKLPNKIGRLARV